MNEPSLFDYQQSIAAKDAGMQQAAENSPTALEIARRVARDIAMSRPSREVTADDVGERIAELYSIDSLGPASGSLFKESCWEFTGRRVTSKRVRNHGRELKVWRLRKDCG